MAFSFFCSASWPIGCYVQRSFSAIAAQLHNSVSFIVDARKIGRGQNNHHRAISSSSTIKMLVHRRNAVWEERSRRGFEELQQLVGVDASNSACESPTTNKDRQLHATNVLFETSARLDNGATILELCQDLLRDDAASSLREREWPKRLRIF